MIEVYEDGSDYVPGGYTKREEGLTVTNTRIPDTDPTNITSLKFVKTWIGVTDGQSPTITVQVRNRQTGEVVKTATLQYPDTELEWKNLPYRDDDNNVIEYIVVETDTAGFEASDPVETGSSIEEIKYTSENSSLDWPIDNPSFVITRTTRNGPFIIWTLNHLPASERDAFLQNIFTVAGDGADQPIKDLKKDYPNVDIRWIEGANVSYDVFPPDDNGFGMITIEITFNDDGSIASSNLLFEKQSTWTHFAVGRYSSKKVEITNKYKASGTWAPLVYKELGGRELKSGEFSFVLKKDGNIIQTKTNDEHGNVAFDAVDFDQDDIGKIYNYTIEEIVPDPAEGGMVYDSMVINVKVEIKDAGGGHLNIIVTYPEDITFNNSYFAEGEWTPEVSKELSGRELKDNEFTFVLKETGVEKQRKTNAADGRVVFDWIDYQQDDIGKTFDYTIEELIPDPVEAGMSYDPLIVKIQVTVEDAGGGLLEITTAYSEDRIFNNSYLAEGGWTPEVAKVLSGRDLKEGEFTFVLKEGDLEHQRKTNAADGSIIFDQVNYDQTSIGKNYLYTIEEVLPDLVEGGMSYDPLVVSISVKVEDAGGGLLEITTEYSEDTVFNNAYVAKGFFTPKVMKELAAGGRHLEEGEFTFNLKKDGIQIEEVTNALDGTVVFSAMKFTEEDIGQSCTLTIEEVIPDPVEQGMSYDPMKLEILLEIKDGTGGELEITPHYPEDMIFNNRYEARGEVTLEIYKELLYEDALIELGTRVFNFEVFDGEDLVATGKNDEDGKVVFSVISYTEEDIGKTFHYRILEKEEDLGGVTYSKEEVHVQVNVTDLKDGILKTEIIYPEDRTITNLYEVSPIEVELEALKILKVISGKKELEAGMFMFEVYQADMVFATGTNDKDGKVVFTPIEFKRAGNYDFKIREVKGDAYGMTYSESIFDVRVTVVDNHDGSLSATANYPEEAIFTNIYEISEISHSATKIWEGDDAVTRPEFVFTLYRKIKDGEGEAVSGQERKVVTTEKPTATWDNLPEVDDDENFYIYYVVESFKDGGLVENDNWEFGDYDFDQDTITNKVIQPKGELTIRKELIEQILAPGIMGSGEGKALIFSFKVTGPYGYVKTFELQAGKSMTLKDLYYGKYTVEETQAH